MKKKIFLMFLMSVATCTVANAEIIVNSKNNTIINTDNNNVAAPDWQNDPVYLEAQEIAILEKDINILDAEIDKCKKKKKAWTAATVVGGVGVVATGVGAIVQANKISDKKSELADKNAELERKQTELRNLK